MSEWQRFFALRLPIAVVGAALVLEAMAALLSGVTPHRHNVDDLASAVLHDRHPYKAVLVGDSVTHNVAHRFRIGAVDEVADLTTHANAGLPSSLFLLKRYLESGHRPQHVVIAASRTVFTLPIDHGTFAYYVTSVFRQPYERAFLQRYYPSYVSGRWTPAALSITASIGEPLFSLIRHPGDEIWQAPDVPAPTPALDSFAGDIVDPVLLELRYKDPTLVRPEAEAILNEFCELSHRYKFSLHLIWAPTPPQIWKTMQLIGTLGKMDSQVAAIFAQNHTVVTMDDTNSAQVYPYFDREMVHIKGAGWEQIYALQLSSYIRQFEKVSGAPAAAAR